VLCELHFGVDITLKLYISYISGDWTLGNL